ncbi:MAG: hypothetical protein COA78_22190 [Blastopirellula sp.]|nr:MAG: hypothetical protein COA78_22190 [Blastopirellula sp.]
MGEVINMNESKQEIINLLEQLELLVNENSLQAIAVCYIETDGNVNYTWTTPKNTIKMIGGLEVLKQVMSETLIRD